MSTGNINTRTKQKGLGGHIKRDSTSIFASNHELTRLSQTTSSPTAKISNSGASSPRKRSFSLRTSFPKCSKQMLDQSIKTNQSVYLLLQDQKMRKELLKGLSKKRKSVLSYIVQDDVIESLIDMILCKEEYNYSSEYCHWAAHILTNQMECIFALARDIKHLNHLFKFIDEDYCTLKYIGSNSHNMPNNMQYFLSLMDKLLTMRGRSVIKYLLLRGKEYVSLMMGYFPYNPFSSLLYIILSTETRIQTEDNKLSWFKKFDVFTQMISRFLKFPKKCVESFLSFLTNLSTTSTQEIYVPILRRTLLKNLIPTVIKLISYPETTSDGIELYFTIWRLLRPCGTETIGILINDTILETKTIRQALISGNALVSLHAFSVIFQLLVKELITTLVKDTLKSITEVFFKYPLQSVFHNAVTNLYVYILHYNATWLEPLKTLLLDKMKLQHRMKRVCVHGTDSSHYIGHFQRINEKIPITYKDTNWCKFENTYLKLPNEFSYFSISDKLRRKKNKQLGKQILVD